MSDLRGKKWNDVWKQFQQNISEFNFSTRSVGQGKMTSLTYLNFTALFYQTDLSDVQANLWIERKIYSEKNGNMGI